MTGRIVDLGAVRELRRLTAELECEAPDVEQVRQIAQAAWRARDHRWMAWASLVFDEAHQRAGCCDYATGTPTWPIRAMRERQQA